MVSNLVSNAGCPPRRVPPRPLGIPYMNLTRDWGIGTVNLTVLSLQGDGACCVSTMEWAYFYAPLLRKREKDVGSVGCVAQSEKSTENSQ